MGRINIGWTPSLASDTPEPSRVAKYDSTGLLKSGTPAESDPASSVVTKEYIENKQSIVENITLLASNWTNTGQYTINNTNILSPTQIIQMIPGQGISASQLEMLQFANIIGGTQSVGRIILVALGVKPTANIPVTFIFKHDVN